VIILLDVGRVAAGLPLLQRGFEVLSPEFSESLWSDPHEDAMDEDAADDLQLINTEFTNMFGRADLVFGQTGRGSGQTEYLVSGQAEDLVKSSI